MRHCRALAVLWMLSASLVVAPVASANCATEGQECVLRQRISVAESYLAERPGTVGFVLRDRVTGARYRSAAAGTPIWTASTIKLAMVADLLSREQAGALRLTAADREQMAADRTTPRRTRCGSAMAGRRMYSMRTSPAMG